MRSVGLDYPTPSHFEDGVFSFRRSAGTPDPGIWWKCSGRHQD